MRNMIRRFADLPGTINGGAVNADFLPDGEPVAMAGGKWTLAKAASVKYAKDRSTGAFGWVVNNGKNDPKKTNLSGLKLSYAAKTGAFKGSFKAYALEKGKIKAYTVNIEGVMVGNTGYGTATLKKPAVSFPVTIE